MTKTELFLELAKPDKNGKSRWVFVDEFVGEYKELKLGNGGSWCRKSSTLAKKYIVEFDKSKTSGNSIDAVRLNGFNTEETFNQAIRKDIKDYYKNKPCVILGIVGNSENTKIEIDHKEGTKDSQRISNQATQKLDDFQPITKAANDAKRQYCKECRRTGIRYDAKKLGYPMSYYKGGATHNNEENACEGCYWYDPIEFKKHLQEKK